MLIKKLKDMGLNIIPLKVDSKVPAIPWKEFQTEKYTGEFLPKCNIGVVCGVTSNNLIVIDLDDESLYKDWEDYNTFTVKTRRGYHLYFNHTENKIINGNKFIDNKNRHIDVKLDGGYVVGAGSIHPDTKQEYKIVKDVPILTTDIKELMNRLTSTGFKKEHNLTLGEIKNGAGEGDRNDVTFKYACYLIREGQLSGEALQLEIEKLNSRHDPPLSTAELKVIITSALKYESHNLKKNKWTKYIY